MEFGGLNLNVFWKVSLNEAHKSLYRNEVSCVRSEQKGQQAKRTRSVENYTKKEDQKSTNLDLFCVPVRNNRLSSESSDIVSKQFIFSYSACMFWHIFYATTTMLWFRNITWTFFHTRTGTNRVLLWPLNRHNGNNNINMIFFFRNIIYNRRHRGCLT